MEDVRILMLVLLGRLVADLLKTLNDGCSSVSSVVTQLGDKNYKITLEEVADDSEV